MEHDHASTLHKPESHTHYALPVCLVLGYGLFEAWGGWWTGSLALLSDAGHMLTDALSLALAWFAAYLATRETVSRHSSGLSYAEIAASLINIALMLMVIAGIVLEAWVRLKAPPSVAAGNVIWIALMGLVVNLLVASMLHQHAHHHDEDINKQAAYLHVLGDLLGSLAAIIAGVVIYFTGWQKIDPILSFISALLLAVMTLQLASRLYRRVAAHSHT